MRERGGSGGRSAPGRRGEVLRFELPLGLLGAALVALAGAFSVVGIPEWIPPALIVRLGVPSPLTGMTRSFVAMVSGNFATAFAWHPLGPLLFALCVAMPVLAIVSLARGARFDLVTRMMSSRGVWPGIGVLAALAWAGQIVSFG